MSLVIRDLNVSHGAIQAVRDLNLHVQKGELCAVVGSNGAGKTTLLRALTGLKSAHSGEATWDGHALLNVNAEKTVRHGVAHVCEGKSVIPELTVEENLLLGALWRRNKTERMESLEFVTSTFPRLGERLSQRADTLSGGERQMLAIGRSMMSKPELLLLDEPSLGLAPLVVEQIFQAIRTLTNTMNLTVLLVEQNAMGALRIADTGVVLDLGRIVIEGKAEDLINNPHIKSAYLGY